jgi:hypothetical protein
MKFIVLNDRSFGYELPPLLSGVLEVNKTISGL